MKPAPGVNSGKPVAAVVKPAKDADKKKQTGEKDSDDTTKVRKAIVRFRIHFKISGSTCVFVD